MIENGEAFDIAQKENIPGLRSNQEKTDSRIVLYCIYARVRSPDSDKFWILLYHATEIDITILFDTGHGNKKRLINITNLSEHYTKQMCEAILALHAFTGCDSVSSFRSIGKSKPLKLLLKSPVHCDALKHLGDDWNVDDDLLIGCEKFTCVLYGKSKFESVDEVRHLMLKSKCDGDISVDSLKSNTSVPKWVPF